MDLGYSLECLPLCIVDGKNFIHGAVFGMGDNNFWFVKIGEKG